MVLEGHEVQAGDLGELRELHDRVRLLGDRRDEDAELQLVGVVGHARKAMELELCVETHGNPDDPAVLLIMGAAASMDRWEPGCASAWPRPGGTYPLRPPGHGGSTSDPPGEPSYTGDDSAADVLRVLDRVGVERAHLVGISRGGALAQMPAVHHRSAC